MKVVAIIQARLSSTRLPRKVLADLHGKPLIDHVIERAQAVNGVDLVVLNVPEDDRELQVGRACPVYPVKNQEQDVLGSYLHVAEWAKADVIVRLTGDCWSICPEVSSKVIELYLQGGCDYASNIQPFTTWPDGLDTEVFSMNVLRRAASKANTDYDRQHVTSWIREHAICGYLPCSEDCSDIFLSVNTQNDLDLARKIMSRLGSQLDYQDLLRVLREEGIWDGRKTLIG